MGENWCKRTAFINDLEPYTVITELPPSPKGAFFTVTYDHYVSRQCKLEIVILISRSGTSQALTHRRHLDAHTEYKVMNTAGYCYIISFRETVLRTCSIINSEERRFIIDHFSFHLLRTSHAQLTVYAILQQSL